jgi:hypothetical protein
MRKPISPTLHGVMDYVTVATTLVAPHLMRLPAKGAKASTALGAGYLMLSALTNYPLALKRVVPFKAHGAVEAASIPLLFALPFVLKFSAHKQARNYFFFLAAMTVVVAALTDWNAEA